MKRNPSYDKPILLGTRFERRPIPRGSLAFELSLCSCATAGEATIGFNPEIKRVLKVQVQTADGKPLPDVSVVRIGPPNKAVLNGTSIEAGSERIRADADGKFAIEWSGTNFGLAAANDAGFSLAQSRDLIKNPVMVVQPWARIEGNRINQNRPLANQPLFLQVVAFSIDMSLMEWIDVLKEQSITDFRGRFVFEHVPPVDVRLHDFIGNGSKGTPVFCGLQYIYPKPGETARVEVATQGRTVVGRIQAEEDLPTDIDLSSVLCGWSPDVEWVKLGRPAVPREFDTADKRAAWWHDWYNTDAGRQRLAALNAYRWTHIQPDGSFVVKMVEPGRYWVNGGLVKNGEKLAELNEHPVIPTAQVGEDSPLDIGKVILKRIKNLRKGDTAPDFTAKTLDGQPVALSDFRGKYLLLDFWATWCGPCVAEIPILKATYDAFGNEDRFVMVSLSLDSDAALPKKFCKDRGMPWKQVFLGQWSKDPVTQAYGVTAIPEVFLIGPDGKILGIGLRGPKIKEAVAGALGH